MTQDELQEIFERVARVATKAPGTGNDDCDAVIHYDAPLLVVELTKLLSTASAIRVFLERTNVPDITDDTDLALLVRKVLDRNDARVVHLDQQVQRLERDNEQLRTANVNLRQRGEELESKIRGLLADNGQLETELEELSEENAQLKTKKKRKESK